MIPNHGEEMFVNRFDEHIPFDGRFPQALYDLQ